MPLCLLGWEEVIVPERRGEGRYTCEAGRGLLYLWGGERVVIPVRRGEGWMSRTERRVESAAPIRLIGWTELSRKFSLPWKSASTRRAQQTEGLTSSEDKRERSVSITDTWDSRLRLKTHFWSSVTFGWLWLDLGLWSCFNSGHVIELKVEVVDFRYVKWYLCGVNCS